MSYTIGLIGNGALLGENFLPAVLSLGNFFESVPRVNVSGMMGMVLYKRFKKVLHEDGKLSLAIFYALLEGVN